MQRVIYYTHMVTNGKTTKYEGDKAVARKAGKCECVDPTCARTIQVGETFFIGPQKDYSHGPYAYNRINIHCPTAVKYVSSSKASRPQRCTVSDHLCGLLDSFPNRKLAFAFAIQHQNEH